MVNCVVTMVNLYGINKMVLLLIVLSSMIMYLINYYALLELAPGLFTVAPNPPEDIYGRLIDYQGFKFLINPRICRRNKIDLFVLVAISSSPRNHAIRTAIRKSWGRWDEHMKVVFYLGVPDDKVENLTRQIRIENEIYGDIVQGNFIDSHRNLSYKHVMILKWMVHHCNEAKFVVKIDDYVVVDLYGLYDLLEKDKWGRRGVMVCQIKNNSRVASKSELWNILVQEYSESFYPTYCSGFTVIYSSDVVHRLLEASQRIPYYFKEDVYVTGILAKEIGVKHAHFNLPFLTVEIAAMLMLGQRHLVKGGPYIIGPLPFLSKWQYYRKLWTKLQSYNFKFERLNRIRGNNVNAGSQLSDKSRKKLEAKGRTVKHRSSKKRAKLTLFSKQSRVQPVS